MTDNKYRYFEIFTMPNSAKSNDLIFATLTVINWIDIFTRDEYKLLITNSLSFCIKNKGLRVFEYVLMTNHLHIIAQSDIKPMSDILRDFKTFTAKELQTNPQESRKEWMVQQFTKAGRNNPANKEIQVWQNGNYPVILYSKEMVEQKRNYIYQNPVRAGIVAEPHHYLYSSANLDSPLKCNEW